jgi:hypothetical protein
VNQVAYVTRQLKQSVLAMKKNIWSYVHKAARSAAKQKGQDLKTIST